MTPFNFEKGLAEKKTGGGEGGEERDAHGMVYPERGCEVIVLMIAVAGKREGGEGSGLTVRESICPTKKRKEGPRSHFIYANQSFFLDFLSRCSSLNIFYSYIHEYFSRMAKRMLFDEG